MIDISFDLAVKLQECFFHDAVFSPFELAEDYKIFYPLAILGETGSLLNDYCKSIRSPNSYEKNMRNDLADIFIYLLLFGRMLEKHEKLTVFDTIRKDWNAPPKKITNDAQLGERISVLNEKVAMFFSDNKMNYYNSTFFGEMFSIIKELNLYLTLAPWQEIINEFHTMAIDEFTRFEKYTPDLWYNGSCFVDLKKLTLFIEETNIPCPKKRVLFLKRLIEKK